MVASFDIFATKIIYIHHSNGALCPLDDVGTKQQPYQNELVQRRIPINIEYSTLDMDSHRYSSILPLSWTKIRHQKRSMYWT
ncbi:hypothetical protein PsorP6_016029 [Peronosclerospora sorghi]|uniref:Uncharacterized protein n=1 Tax=Peronosclerospora sorghi TaxID=230839 RepID=A0ACC0WRB2_9STRA|nr:hypothetical protein PsorP6_016029 [Peronosclerospora sorghi]